METTERFLNIFNNLHCQRNNSNITHASNNQNENRDLSTTSIVQRNLGNPSSFSSIASSITSNIRVKFFNPRNQENLMNSARH